MWMPSISRRSRRSRSIRGSTCGKANEMTTSQLRFPDYGDDGDVAGAHRSRWAFRLSVISLAVLTLSSCIAEHRLRYTQAESNFLYGITQANDSARVFLQSAVRLDAGASKTPTP